MLTDKFNGDNAKLIDAIESMLDLDAKGALVPHGVGGHARTMLAAAAVRLAASPAADSQDERAAFIKAYAAAKPASAHQARDVFDQDWHSKQMWSAGIAYARAASAATAHVQSDGDKDRQS